MDCNDENVKGFVGYKYPTYACFSFKVCTATGSNCIFHPVGQKYSCYARRLRLLNRTYRFAMAILKTYLFIVFVNLFPTNVL